MRSGLSLHKYLLVICVSVLLLILGFYSDIRFKLMHLSQIYAKENVLSAQIKEATQLLAQQEVIEKRWQEMSLKISRYLRSDNKSVEAGELLAAIQHAGEVNGLAIESIQPGVWQSYSDVNGIDIHLRAVGNYFQFVEFITMLKQYSLPIELCDFSLHANQQGNLQIDLQLLGFYVPTVHSHSMLPNSLWFPIEKSPYSFSHDPFSRESQFELTNQSDDPNLLKSAFLRQIKLVGYLHQDKRFWALVMLPNGKTSEMTRDSLVGFEKARVVKLDEHSVVLVVENHKVRLEYLQ